MSYKTPGVYVEEISTLPPSVATVATAIPAFIGCTQKGPQEPTRISTMIEYENIFGGPNNTNFEVIISQAPNDEIVIENLEKGEDSPKHLMYYSLQMYFKNGGGPCYIISVGWYDEEVGKLSFFPVSETPGNSAKLGALERLEKLDEPTLIVLTDAPGLLAEAKYYDLCQQALAQCEKLKDRFVIFDVLNTDKDAGEFRDKIGQSSLKYGAAYMPYLLTSLNYAYREQDVIFKDFPVQNYTTGENGLKITYIGNGDYNPKVTFIDETEADAANIDFEVKKSNSNKEITLEIKIKSGENGEGQLASAVFTAWQASKKSKGSFLMEAVDDGSASISPSSVSEDIEFRDGTKELSLADIKPVKTALYNQAKAALNNEYVTMPPSAAIAGVYARVDRQRGVWKAPANVSLASVIAPTERIGNDQQDLLNIDPNAGKSINVIRAFSGKGVLVWGARTLAGNDNEWRYINVRRLFNLIEESIQKATNFAVFEANDATTWLKVKALIDSFLYGLWQQGALAGSAPEQAYFTNVGLGKTMTTQDVLEGRMNVEIGIAAVRPAEFIILKFSHKLQEV